MKKISARNKLGSIALLTIGTLWVINAEGRYESMILGCGIFLIGALFLVRDGKKNGGV